MISQLVLPDNKQRAFQHFRDLSLNYLSTIDTSGYLGWNKVDPKIREIIHLIHRNPHLFHYGESCGGHLTATKSPPYQHGITRGYITIGQDDSDEAIKVVNMLDETFKGEPLVEAKFETAQFYERGENLADLPIYRVLIAPENIQGEKNSTPEQYMASYDKIWAKIERGLKPFCERYPSIMHN